jgi:hypothetical protein
MSKNFPDEELGKYFRGHGLYEGPGHCILKSKQSHGLRHKLEGKAEWHLLKGLLVK